MKQKLYGNAKRLTTIFGAALAIVTVILLVLRVSVFRDMASAPEAQVETISGKYLVYTINRQIYFAKPTSKGNIRIENLSEKDYYMTVDIIDPETELSYLYTGFIERGTPMDTIPLNKPLENGVYQFTAVVSTYDMNSRELLAKENEPVTIYVGATPEPAEE